MFFLIIIITPTIFNTLSIFLATLFKIYAKFEINNKITLVFSY